jgi:glycosyltransferase
MRVSIVTVVYNNKEFIQQAIDSVKAQDYPEIEHLVIDGGSSDGTLEIIQKNTHVKYISERDKGLYDAMNKGVHLATGEVIGMLNSDDLFKDATVVSKVVAKFRETPHAQIVFGNLEYVKRESPGEKVRIWVTGKYYPHFFDDGLVPPHPTVYIRRDVYQKHFYDLSYKLAADYEFMLRVFKGYGYCIEYVNSILVSMRLGGVTNRNLKNILDQNLEIRRAWVSNRFGMSPAFWLKRIFFKVMQFLK